MRNIRCIMGACAVAWLSTLFAPAIVRAADMLEGPFARRGRFTLREVVDPEKGACLELELHPTIHLPALVREYATLTLKQPVAVVGRPHTIGMWVRGNSNWGRIYFEIDDAEGRQWRSSGGYNDWPADLAVNFDGWRFMRFHIDPERSPVPNHSPGLQWQSSSGGTAPVYPIRIVGITVTMRRTAPDPVEMRPVTPILRFRDIGAYE
jgi:hypothetical protein